VLAGGTIHDPIYGGHMSITYELPTSGPVSFSEAPKRSNLTGKVQCTQSTSNTASTSTATTTASSTSTATTASSTTVCLGTISGTSITIASRQSQADVQALFASLKADVNWVPTDTTELLATATPTGS
jgi:arginine repressor